MVALGTTGTQMSVDQGLALVGIVIAVIFGIYAAKMLPKSDR
jgi:hypothetical protein